MVGRVLTARGRAEERPLPYLRLELLEGRHRVRLEGSNGGEHRETVVVRPGEEATVKAKL
jgi:hypothetical protein